jgi:hypothetical protein
MNHPGIQQLQEYADGVRSEGVERHLRSCASCRTRLERLHELEGALRRLPLENVAPEFTERVMKQIGIRESANFGWSIVRNLAPFVALTIVLGVLAAVMKFSGSGVPESAGQAPSMASAALVKVSAALGSATAWVQKVLPFAFPKQGYGITVFVLLFLGLVGMLDRYVIAPLLRKRIWPRRHAPRGAEGACGGALPCRGEVEVPEEPAEEDPVDNEEVGRVRPEVAQEKCDRRVSDDAGDDGGNDERRYAHLSKVMTRGVELEEPARDDGRYAQQEREARCRLSRQAHEQPCRDRGPGTR